MTSRDFCFWLQGYIEISAGGANPDVPMTLGQLDCVQRHLALVFKHEIDPSMGDQKKQDTLNAVHSVGLTESSPGIHGNKLRC